MTLAEKVMDSLMLDEPDWSGLARLAMGETTNHTERITASVVRRFCTTMYNKAYLDAAVLLRQIIRGTHGFQMSASVWDLLIAVREKVGLVGLNTSEGVEVSVRPWHANWLDDTDMMDHFALRSTQPTIIGDGMLNAMRPSWMTYRSEAQKAAIDLWMFAPPGSTTLVTLPTGGGKSLSIILPAWFDSQGGQLSAGTTIVVVPTVALALDQQRNAEQFFRGSEQPRARIGSDSQWTRSETSQRLRDGSLPVLFTSPESLLNSLHDVALDAAADGLITRLVIDEAHLIETWGAGFRPEFQLLAGYRRQLLAASKGRLRTLLLSATVSAQSRHVLEYMFSEPDSLIMIRANRLRPEVGYWFNVAASDSVRNERVTDVLHHLPRPLILYVTQPNQAQAWHSRLTDEGYTRLGVFTGETGSEERQALLDAWMQDEIDIMIGTSAFGLGVDKPNVRAVIHATLPENIDRFYQEVGRGGRDGYSTISLVCTCPQDIPLAQQLSPKRITHDKAEPRWRAMLEVQGEAPSGDLRYINRDAVPHGKHRFAQEKDREWNDHILLILQRAGVIEIVETPPSVFRYGSTPDSDAVVLIRVRDPHILDDRTAFKRIFDAARESELTGSGSNSVYDIAKSYTDAEENDCIAAHFAAVYESVQQACGGCPSCRASRLDAYGGNTLDFQVKYPAALARSVSANGALLSPLVRRLGAWRSFTVTANSTYSQADANLITLLRGMVRAGTQQIVLPDALIDDPVFGAELVRGLADDSERHTPVPHRLIPVRWLMRGDRPPLLPLASVIVYPHHGREADRVYAAVRDAMLPACVHVIPTGLRLPGVGKLFIDHVDGLNEPIDRFNAFLTTILG